MIDEEVTHAIRWIYKSYVAVSSDLKQGYDRHVRHPEWTRRLLDLFESPDASMYNVAVTGSKGKGTHAILLAAMLQRAGLRVGLFTSPHLVDFLERLRIDGEPIDAHAFVRLADEVRQMTTQLKVPPNQYLGPIGLLAVMASLWFRNEQTDVNVFELGRGALHDDVNQVRHQGAILTPVFDEHLEKLGPTVSQVICEKLGVVTKDTRWLVSNRQDDEVWSEIAKRASNVLLPTRYPTDFVADVAKVKDAKAKDAKDVHCVRTSCEGVALTAFVSLHVACYAANVATALQAYFRVMRDFGYDSRPNLHTVDLTDLRLPGKLQVFQPEAGPVCLIDGSIHGVNASIVVEWMLEHGQDKEVWALLSLPDDKDAMGVIDKIGPHVHHIWLTTSSNRHLSYVRDWSHYARRYTSDVRVFADVEDAVKKMIGSAAPAHLALLLGTQSFVGDVLRTLRVPTQSIWR